MRAPKDTPRLLHLVIMGLLVFSVVQVGWWFYDIRGNAQVNATAMKMVYGYDILAAQKLLDQGSAPDQVAAIFPYARVDGGKVTLAPEALQELDLATEARMTQYAWEGGFFLLVQACAIAVLWRGLASETAIRRKQDSFLAMVSHQFKTPIASLQLSLETMLLRQLSPDREGDQTSNARFQQLSQRMLDDLRRMENMVSKILDSARLDRGRVQLNRERLFLAEAVRHVVAHLEDTARRGNIAVQVSIPSDLEITADPMALDGVLRNLIENAIAAMGPTKGGTLAVNAVSIGASVELTVRDTGIGFEPAQGPKLFDKFFRLDTTGGRDAAGTGLGLYIVQRFMHFEDGAVRASSEGPGKGATFTVTWPASGPGSRIAA
jgi:signal transduction histidine kinase